MRWKQITFICRLTDLFGFQGVEKNKIERNRMFWVCISCLVQINIQRSQRNEKRQHKSEQNKEDEFWKLPEKMSKAFHFESTESKPYIIALLIEYCTGRTTETTSMKYIVAHIQSVCATRPKILYSPRVDRSQYSHNIIFVITPSRLSFNKDIWILKIPLKH